MMNGWDIFLLILIAGSVILAFRRIQADRKAGKSCLGCTANCSGNCAACSVSHSGTSSGTGNGSSKGTCNGNREKGGTK